MEAGSVIESGPTEAMFTAPNAARTRDYLFGEMSAAIASAAVSNAVLTLRWYDLALASALVLVAMAISTWQHLGLAREWPLVHPRRRAARRVGYVLAFLISMQRWYLVLLALLVMLIAATLTATTGRRVDVHAVRDQRNGDACRRRSHAGIRRCSGHATASMVRPQYLIPLFG